MPLPPNTLNQALNQLPQFLLALGQMQERRGEREERAQRANEQELARKSAFELELVRMAMQAGDADVQVASIPGLRKSVSTRKGQQAVEMFAPMARERQRQQQILEKTQVSKDLFQREMDKLNVAIKAAGLGVEGADEQVTAGLGRIAAFGGATVDQDEDIAPTGTIDTLGLGIDVRAAGIGGVRGLARREPEAPIGQLFDVSDPTTLGGLVSPARRLTLGEQPSIDNLSQLFNLLNAAR